MTEPTAASLSPTPFMPHDPDVRHWFNLFGVAYPEEFTNWKEEVMSWKETAYLHAGLNPTTTYRVWGPDALRLLSEHCVNGFTKFEIGSARHAIMCNDDGNVMAHGVLVRLGDEEFMTYWLMPWIDFLVEAGDYDVQGENLTGTKFLFQIAGPKALEILEAATRTDLHDIRFLRQKSAAINGTDVGVRTSVDVLRLGMAGSLAYELHGPIEQAKAVYSAVVDAGEPMGLRRLGLGQYNMNHTENGFPQGHMHFLYPWFEDANLASHLGSMGKVNPPALGGSAGQDWSLRYRNPVELGWGRTIKFDHEFQGRAALERLMQSPKRTMVTLSWNVEDIFDIYRSHFEPGQEYQYMEFTQEHSSTASAIHHSDLVVAGGKNVGISSGRIYSYYYRAMISLCSIDVSESEIGNEVIVVWGDEGTRQKNVRATVERFPLFDEGRNETVDVSGIPGLGAR